MNVLNLHSWDVDTVQAKQIQEQLSDRLVVTGGPEQVKWVGGTDVSYNRTGYRIGLKRSMKTVLQCCRAYRIPEPLRRAHHFINQLRK